MSPHAVYSQHLPAVLSPFCPFSLLSFLPSILICLLSPQPSPPLCPCSTRLQLITERVDVTAKLRELNIHPKRAVLHVMVESSTGAIEPLEATPVPAPVLVGPKYNLRGASVASGGSAEPEDVKEIQRLVGASVDGECGPQTEEAIKAFQRAAGLKEDGIAGPVTKAAAIAADGMMRDGGAEVTGPSPYAGRRVITYAVDLATLPSSLRERSKKLSRRASRAGTASGDLEDRIDRDLGDAFGRWEAATGVTFQRLQGAGALEAADITLSFAPSGASGLPGGFDGPGGSLAHATHHTIEFDAEENWACTGDAVPAANEDSFWEARAFYLMPVAVHEIGHCIGLGHSANPADVMAPFYRIAPNGAAPPLTKDDIARARQILAVDA